MPILLLPKTIWQSRCVAADGADVVWVGKAELSSPKPVFVVARIRHADVKDPGAEAGVIIAARFGKGSESSLPPYRRA